jgi:hypothetical protein
LRIGFPHSEICGSKSARLSSQLIAACYVLHRLCAPRHPPDALALTLDRSAFRSMPRKKASEDCSPMAIVSESGSTQLRSVFGVFRVNRSCKPANPAFTMSEIFEKTHQTREISRAMLSSKLLFSVVRTCRGKSGRRWWSRSGSNRRPEACKATALPTELRPRIRFGSDGGPGTS